MKTKSFKKYLEKRLDKDEIAEIEEQAQLEVKSLQSIPKSFTKTKSNILSPLDDNDYK